ncbi:hypothetical protein LLT3_16295 [Lactococcus cremoris subsp. cremoris TIFN3]|uniref:Uncharacterized protein n=1 Tax=Lactococcus cremoris subsp. cremoris TIFN3 TaxID=1234873 RepID=T0V7L3_LACLC|nr:hypothetical protein LLT3_16295 [Lactococcus cremoris subsp. cremoris TIFN3]
MMSEKLKTIKEQKKDRRTRKNQENGGDYGRK